MGFTKPTIFFGTNYWANHGDANKIQPIHASNQIKQIYDLSQGWVVYWPMHCSPSFFFSNLQNRVNVVCVLAYALLQAQKIAFLNKKIISTDQRTPLSGPKIPQQYKRYNRHTSLLYIRESHGSMLFKIYFILSWILWHFFDKPKKSAY